MDRDGDSDKDVIDAGPSTLPISYPSSSSVSPQSKRRLRSRLRLFRPGIPTTLKPLLRRLRWLLGPPHPIPLPKPKPSLSAAFTFLNHSSISHPDTIFHHTNPKKKKRQSHLLLPFLALWTTGLILLVRQQYYLPSPIIIGCTASIWPDWPPDICGLDGMDCVTDLEDASGRWRCMGGCAGVGLGNPRWVGGVEVDRRGLIIGGEGGIYRADSWICPSAIHAGLINPSLGGTVSLTTLPFPTGSSNFTNSTSNGITSTGFIPSYPGAYQLQRDFLSHRWDIHPFISTYNGICLAIFTLLLRPLPGTLFSTLLILGYAQITLVSDPPNQPPDWSGIFGGLIPVLATGYWIYRVSFQRTLTAFRDLPVELTLWQGLGYWIGIESSTVFAKLPISRLGYDSLDPGGVASLTIIILVVAVVAVIQALEMRRYGLLHYYLLRYLPLIPLIILLATLPGYYLRPHHYLLALLALPVLSLPNRPSLFFQAFMLGLFLDGVGRWGWDSITQTKDQLLGDAFAGTVIPLVDLTDSTGGLLSWSGWNDTAYGDGVGVGVDGVGVLVDDLLRVTNVTANSLDLSTLDLADGISHFFRLAWIVNGSSWDYTDPIEHHSNGSWSILEPLVM